MTDDEITEAMMRYGGGFVADLGALFRRADAENQAILKAAFPHYWIEYAAFVAPRAVGATPREGPPRCPRCGCYQWIYKGDKQVCADCYR